MTKLGKPQLTKPKPRVGGQALTGRLLLVLDETGSMSPYVEETIAAYNTYVAAMQQAAPEATLTRVKVDWPNTGVQPSTTLRHATPLDEDSYCPMGSTDLYDGLAAGLEKLGLGEAERPKVCVVLTDGGDNMSRYTAPQLRDILTQYRQAGWTFVWLGANQDACDAGRAIGADTVLLFDQADMAGAFRQLEQHTAGLLTGPAGAIQL